MEPAAADAMAAWLAQGFGNPSGSHRVARAARQALEESRDRVAAFIGVAPGEVVFTSGGTESDNLAVLGAAGGTAGAVVISAVEHPAVSEAALASGREVRVAPVDPDGIIDLDALKALLRGEVSVVSIQLVNSETGVIQPFADIARRVRKWSPGALLHTDAVQAAPWLDLRQAAGGADLITISGHKIGGPQGTGALAIRDRPALRAQIHGGGQERELRSGTQNVAGAIGLAAAVDVVSAARTERAAVVTARRDDLAARILAGVDRSVHTAVASPRVPGHLHLQFAGVESEALLVLLDEEGVCASAGSACASGAMEPSPVLLAMGLDKVEAQSSLRMTLGPTTTAAELDHAARVVPAAVRRLRED